MPALDKDTFEGALRVLHKNIGELKQLLDADLPWVIEIETMLLDKIRSPERMLQQRGLIPPGGQNPAGNAALGLPGAPPMGGAGGPPGGGLPLPPGGPGGPLPPDVGMSIPPSAALGAGGPPGISSPGPGPSPDDLAALLGAGV